MANQSSQAQINEKAAKDQMQVGAKIASTDNKTSPPANVQNAAAQKSNQTLQAEDSQVDTAQPVDLPVKKTPVAQNPTVNTPDKIGVVQYDKTHPRPDGKGPLTAVDVVDNDGTIYRGQAGQKNSNAQPATRKASTTDLAQASQEYRNRQAAGYGVPLKGSVGDKIQGSGSIDKLLVDPFAKEKQLNKERVIDKDVAEPARMGMIKNPKTGKLEKAAIDKASGLFIEPGTNRVLNEPLDPRPENYNPDSYQAYWSAGQGGGGGEKLASLRENSSTGEKLTQDATAAANANLEAQYGPANPTPDQFMAMTTTKGSPYEGMTLDQYKAARATAMGQTDPKVAQQNADDKALREKHYLENGGDPAMMGQALSGGAFMKAQATPEGAKEDQQMAKIDKVTENVDKYVKEDQSKKKHLDTKELTQKVAEAHPDFDWKMLLNVVVGIADAYAKGKSFSVGNYGYETFLEKNNNKNRQVEGDIKLKQGINASDLAKEKEEIAINKSNVENATEAELSKKSKYDVLTQKGLTPEEIKRIEARGEIDKAVAAIGGQYGVLQGAVNGNPGVSIDTANKYQTGLMGSRRSNPASKLLTNGNSGGQGTGKKDNAGARQSIRSAGRTAAGAGNSTPINK